MLYALEDSPIGELLLLGDGEALHGLHMQDRARPISIDEARLEAPRRGVRRGT